MKQSMVEKARLVKTCQSSWMVGGSPWIRPSVGPGWSNTSPSQPVAIDWVTGRWGRRCIKSRPENVAEGEYLHNCPVTVGLRMIVRAMDSLRRKHSRLLMRFLCAGDHA